MIAVSKSPSLSKEIPLFLYACTLRGSNIMTYSTVQEKERRRREGAGIRGREETKSEKRERKHVRIIVAEDSKKG